MLTSFRRKDEGFALVTTLLAMTAVLLLLAGVLSYAVGSQHLSRHDQDWNGALAAAEAGIDDYLYRLNQDGSYWQYGNTITGTDDCDSTGVAPTDGNGAFTGWVEVPGGTSGGSFRYDVTCRPAQTGNGTVAIESTGRVGDVTRTVGVSLRRRNFLDYLYYTDFETKDPALYGSGDSLTPAQAATLCNKHYYDGRDGRCTDIHFISVDAVNGPLHSNDALLITGSPHFNGDTSTSYDPATPPRYLCGGTPCTPVFAIPGDPKYAVNMQMPPSNVDIKNETSPVLATDPTNPGCLFTGPTAIRMNSDGTMDVISPFSKAVNCNWPRTPATSMFQRHTITNFTLPENGGVVYVQNVPPSSDPDNGTDGCPFNQPAIGGNSGGGMTPTRTHPLGFPQKDDLTPLVTGTSATSYGCRNGDAFVQGELDGRLTIGAENNIVLFGSTTYSGGNDLLGLVANNFIVVYHPVTDTNGNEIFNEVQTVTLTGGWDTQGTSETDILSLSNFGSGDWFTLTFEGETTGHINRTARARDVRQALEALSNVVPGDVTVTGPNNGPFTITWDQQWAYANVALSVAQCYSGCTGTVTPSPDGVTGDWFTLTFEGRTTGHINYGAASAAAVRTALEGLSNINSGDVVVEGDEGGPYTVTFQGQYANEDVGQMTITCSGCTGTVATVMDGGDRGPVVCAGSFSSGYCNLPTPGLSSSSTTPSLFNGSSPGSSTMSTVTGRYANRGPVVNAALLTVTHSVYVQNWSRGPELGSCGSADSKLNVNGAIAQLYRGIVGTFSGSCPVSGYAKNYNYDDRLKYDSPPHFLNPVASQWQAVTWAEQKATHSATTP
jgi:hypothetical protein